MVLRFRPPAFPKDSSEYGATQVRYWSLNEENRDTSTPIGINDVHVKVARDGFVYAAIVDTSIRRRAGVIIYRNLRTDQSRPGRIDKVPILDPSHPWNIYLQNATRFIGATRRRAWWSASGSSSGTAGGRTAPPVAADSTGGAGGAGIAGAASVPVPHTAQPSAQRGGRGVRRRCASHCDGWSFIATMPPFTPT